jgi:hypothetical protein
MGWLSYDDIDDVCTGDPAQPSNQLVCGDAMPHSASYLSGPDGPARFSLRIEDRTPASISVVLRRDGATLTSETFELSYTELAPNGVECGPVCQRATVETTPPREP